MPDRLLRLVGEALSDARIRVDIESPHEIQIS